MGVEAGSGVFGFEFGVGGCFGEESGAEEGFLGFVGVDEGIGVVVSSGVDLGVWFFRVDFMEDGVVDGSVVGSRVFRLLSFDSFSLNIMRNGNFLLPTSLPTHFILHFYTQKPIQLLILLLQILLSLLLLTCLQLTFHILLPKSPRQIITLLTILSPCKLLTRISVRVRMPLLIQMQILKILLCLLSRLFLCP